MGRRRTLISEYKQDNREAVILHAPEGLEVDLYESEFLIETRKVYEHSKDYAESLAENWVMGVIKW